MQYVVNKIRLLAFVIDLTVSKEGNKTKLYQYNLYFNLKKDTAYYSRYCLLLKMSDDIFDKKKDDAPMLDLSKTVINTAEEYRAVLDKVPDFKTRPEKVNNYTTRIFNIVIVIQFLYNVYTIGMQVIITLNLQIGPS